MRRLECPVKLKGYSGLVVSSSGDRDEIELEQKATKYFIRTMNRQEFSGNCRNYLQCLDLLISRTVNSRKSTIVKPYQKQ